MEVIDPDATPPDELDDEVFRGSIDELAGTFTAYEQLGIDDLIIGLAPMNIRSLDRLAQALELRNRRDNATPTTRDGT